MADDADAGGAFGAGLGGYEARTCTVGGHAHVLAIDVLAQYLLAALLARRRVSASPARRRRTGP